MNWPHLNILAVDTAMNACGVGIRRNDGMFFSNMELMERGQAERLMPMILELVKAADLTLADIGAYAVTNGPGTFTGLRVGLSTVRALAQASGKRAHGISTFDALADAAGEGNNCILIETKRTDYYVRAPGQPDQCMSPDDLRAIIRDDWILVGDAVGRAITELGLPNKAKPFTSVPPEYLIARAQQMTEGGLPEPVYLRGADVSIARKKAANIVG